MEKTIRCASCDKAVEPAERCHCGNTIGGFCKEHKVLYDLNVLPDCPVCIREDISPEGKKKLKTLTAKRKRGAILVIIAKDGIKMNTKSEPEMVKRSSYSPAAIISNRPRPLRPIPAKVAARLGSNTGVM